MFKPKPQQKEEPPKNMRLPNEAQPPNMKLVRSMFDECERRRGTTIELPFEHGGKNFLLMVLWEKGGDYPIWTLYDEAGGDNSMLFSQGFPPSDLDFVLEMIIMSASQGAAAPVASGFIPEELRPTAESLAAQAEEVKKPDDVWKQSVSRSTHGGLPAQSSVYPDPIPRPEAPPPVPQPMPHMAPPMPPQMPPQPGYPPPAPGYPQMQPGMAPGGQYPAMPPQPGYPPPQPGYPPPQPGYPQMQPPGYPQMQPPGYPPQQFPGQPQPAWPQQAAPPAPPSPQPMPIDLGLISKRTDVTLNSLLLESGLLNSQSLDAALRMQDLVEEKQLTSRDAARVLARYHTKGKTIEQFIAVAMQELGDGGSGAAAGGAPAGAAQGQAMVSVKDALDLLVRSGVLTDNDIQTANEVRKKHGGDISKILAAASKLDEKTFEAAVICVPLIRDGAMKMEQVSIALQYCSRMRTSFDDACAEINWPNPRKR